METSKQLKRLFEIDIKTELRCTKSFWQRFCFHKIRTTLILSKPVFVEMCILELSRVRIYVFYYDYIKNKFDNESRWLLTDTDSLVYEIETKNVFDDFSKNNEYKDALLNENV